MGKSASSSLSDTKLITLGKSCKSSYCIFSLTRYAYWAKCSTITFIHLGFFHFCMGALAFFWSGSWLLLFGFIRNLLNFAKGKNFLVIFCCKNYDNILNSAMRISLSVSKSLSAHTPKYYMSHVHIYICTVYM